MKFLLAATALGFAFYRLYIPHTTTSAVSKFGSDGASALRSSGKVTCRRVFAPRDDVVYELEEKGLPVPPTTYSSWIDLTGPERDAVRTELADKAERFVNLATACRFHPDVELVVHDQSDTPAFTVVLCYSCSKWIASNGTHGRFPKTGALSDIVSRHLLDPGWFQPGDEPPERTVTAFGLIAATSLLNPLNEIRIRRVYAPTDMEKSETWKLDLPLRPNVYSEWAQLNPEQSALARTALLQHFSIWGEYRLACMPRWDLEIEWLDESCQRAGFVTLCHTCGIWSGQGDSGLFWQPITKGIMLEIFPEASELFEY